MKCATIGELLDSLYRWTDSTPLRLPDGKFLDGGSGSYRGFYDALHISYEPTDQGYNTVGSLKGILNGALKRGKMFGYKGGEHEITLETPVWLATDSGDCSRLMVVDVLGDQYGTGLVVVENTWSW